MSHEVPVTTAKAPLSGVGIDSRAVDTAVLALVGVQSYCERMIGRLRDQGVGATQLAALVDIRDQSRQALFELGVDVDHGRAAEA